MAGALVERRLSSEELVVAHLDSIGRLNGAVNAFVTLMPDVAINGARIADAEFARGLYRGPLHGIPVAVKDLFDTADCRTTYGSSFYRDYHPGEDAEAVKRLRAAGAVVLGKTATGEFGSGSTTRNEWYGGCRNPHDTTRAPGGSSGGSAAAVSAGFAAAALGTDAGGSVRGPAALCGVVGLMATFGSVSACGTYNFGSAISQTGVLARRVQDAALVLATIAGHDSQDPHSAERGPPLRFESVLTGIAGARVVVCPDLISIEIDAEVASCFERALHVLRSLGAQVETRGFPEAYEIEKIRSMLSDAERADKEGPRFYDHPHGYGINMRSRILRGLSLSSNEVNLAKARRASLCKAAERLFDQCAVLALPAYACTAADVETLTAWINGRSVPFEGLGVGLLGFANLIGCPAVALPMGHGSDGLPLGLQLIGAPWAEDTLIRIACAYESSSCATGNVPAAVERSRATAHRGNATRP